MAWETSVSGAFKRDLMRQRALPKCRCCSLTNLNASVLTSVVRICLVRALKERKSQLPVGVFFLLPGRQRCRCVRSLLGQRVGLLSCLVFDGKVRNTTKLLLATACLVIALVLFWCVDRRLGKYRANFLTNHRFNLYSPDLFATSIFAP